MSTVRTTSNAPCPVLAALLEIAVVTLRGCPDSQLPDRRPFATMLIRHHLLYPQQCHPERSEGSAVAFEIFNVAILPSRRRSARNAHGKTHSRGVAHNLDMATLPASMYPEHADEYVCDKCDEYITKHFYRGPAHAGIPLGPARYRCQCGETYLSGFVEWDHLGSYHRRRRMGTILLPLALLTVPLLIFLTLANLAFHGSSGLWWAACMLVSIPTIVLLFMSAISSLELIQIAASIWRTRVSGRSISQDHSRT